MGRRQVATMSLIRGLALAALLIVVAALSVPFGAETVVAAPSPGFYDQAEYMIGDVAVSLIFPESDGSIDLNSENWSPERVTACMNEITAGLTWWESLEPRANLHFDIHSFGVLPTSYEPISRPYMDVYLCVDEILAGLGFTSGSASEKLVALNDYVRSEYQTDWAFTIVVVDSLNDADGLFADEYSALAALGGPWLRMTYDNGLQGIDNMDRVVAHEVGHIFYATDEYNNLPESGGYLNVTDNGEYSPFCKMGNVNSWDLCSVSREQVGWRDSDNDNILDPVDTTPRTELLPYSPNPTTHNELFYTGTAEDVPLANQNPLLALGRNNDVTINTITAVQYRIDSGPWYDAQSSDGSFDEVTETFSFTTPPLSAGSHVVEARAQNSVGNWETSYSSDVVEIVSASLLVSTLPATGISATAATLNGNLTGMGTASSVLVSFEWGLTLSYGNETTPPQTLTATGTFSSALSGLAPGTIYHYRAKAVGNGTAYGSDITFVAPSTYPRWDINQDGKVDYKDLAILGAHYGCCTGSPCYYPPADINGNGCMNFVDLAILGAHYGEVY